MAALADDAALSLEAFPEGAWLRTAAFLSMGDCAALMPASPPTRRAKAAATSSLGQCAELADAQLQQLLRVIQAWQRAALERAQQERASAIGALAKPAPLQRGGAGLPEQLRRILEQLEDISGGAPASWRSCSSAGLLEELQQRCAVLSEGAAVDRSAAEAPAPAGGRAADRAGRLPPAAPAPLLLGPEAFPEGAWLCKLALLSLPDCAALTRASPQARRATADALHSLARAMRAADSQFQERLREIDVRQQEARHRAQRERGAADDAVAALAALDDGVAGWVGEMSRSRTARAEEEAAVRRAEEEAEARSRRNGTESEARGLVAQGWLHAAEALPAPAQQ